MRAAHSCPGNQELSVVLNGTTASIHRSHRPIPEGLHSAGEKEKKRGGGQGWRGLLKHGTFRGGDSLSRPGFRYICILNLSIKDQGWFWFIWFVFVSMKLQTAKYLQCRLLQPPGWSFKGKGYFFFEYFIFVWLRFFAPILAVLGGKMLERHKEAWPWALDIFTARLIRSPPSL